MDSYTKELRQIKGIVAEIRTAVVNAVGTESRADVYERQAECIAEGDATIDHLQAEIRSRHRHASEQNKRISVLRQENRRMETVIDQANEEMAELRRQLEADDFTIKQLQGAALSPPHREAADTTILEDCADKLARHRAYGKLSKKLAIERCEHVDQIKDITENVVRLTIAANRHMAAGRVAIARQLLAPLMEGQLITQEKDDGDEEIDWIPDEPPEQKDWLGSPSLKNQAD